MLLNSCASVKTQAYSFHPDFVICYPGNNKPKCQEKRACMPIEKAKELSDILTELKEN